MKANSTRYVSNVLNRGSNVYRRLNVFLGRLVGALTDGFGVNRRGKYKLDRVSLSEEES